ncbi:cyclin-dependent protein kinase inhibitor SMR2 [Ziziphus jujuba]|uniref:Cyclin-dependent protein kinase inhibitor SMR2 n=1 Tax=Ziziphus jujuba TaxID=326968 RepID=A0ABM3I9F8_ZIZJJ|nr:cyclin-dependent protein kinase inhibitor SMR2 [Ziziphus jujuba]
MSKDHISEQQQNLSKIQPAGLDDKREDHDHDHDVQPLKQLLDHDDHHDHQEDPCLTPTSSDHRLPSTRSCPSTPRKPQGRLVYLHKRKLSDLHFFEATRREENEY